jgi:hypothetical protein
MTKQNKKQLKPIKSTKQRHKCLNQKVYKAKKPIDGMANKCPYTDCCTLYQVDSCTCNETGGDYYGAGRMAGCGRELQAKGKKAYCYKEPTAEQKQKTKTKRTNWRWVGIGLVGLALFLVGRMIYLLLTNYS